MQCSRTAMQVDTSVAVNSYSFLPIWNGRRPRGNRTARRGRSSVGANEYTLRDHLATDVVRLASSRVLTRQVQCD